ncbi:MAG: hypothetical protein WC209_08900 [Ignavibacteriaceae bacterium]
MKIYLISILMFGLLLSSEIFTQSHHMGNRKGKAREKIDQLEKIKLIETLNMDEEVSLKFFARRNEFRERGKKLNEKIDSLSRFIGEKTLATDDKTSDTEWEKLIDEFISTEKKLQNNKLEFLISIQKILTPKQVAEFLAFERRFRDEVQEILLRGRRRPIPE